VCASAVPGTVRFRHTQFNCHTLLREVSMDGNVLHINPPRPALILYANGEVLLDWPTWRSPENLRDWARDLRPHAELIVVEEK